MRLERVSRNTKEMVAIGWLALLTIVVAAIVLPPRTPQVQTVTATTAPTNYFAWSCTQLKDDINARLSNAKSYLATSYAVEDLQIAQIESQILWMRLYYGVEGFSACGTNVFHP